MSNVESGDHDEAADLRERLAHAAALTRRLIAENERLRAKVDLLEAEIRNQRAES